MKVCKNCGEINTRDSSFCCNCGQSNFIVQDEIICPHCGVTNDKSFSFCIGCGKLLADSPAVTSVSEEESFTPIPVKVSGDVAGIYDVGMRSIPSETAKCPHCGTLVPITSIFCQKCGASVASLHSRRIVQRKVCPHCGNLNTLDTAYCTYCFSSLADCDTEDLQVTHESQNLGELTVRQTFLEGVKGKKLVCPNCGTLNAAEETFCVNCGLKLVPEPTKRYCPNCGAENPSDSAFCSRCRWSFEGDTPDSMQKWMCPHCGRTNDKEDSYCSHCGDKRHN